MKKSIFKYEYSITGPNGTKTGQVLIKMNFSTKKIKGTHRATHDEYKWTVPVHQIEMIAEGRYVQKPWLAASEKEVYEVAEKWRDALEDHLNQLAHKPGSKNFIDKLRELGFR